MKKIFFIITLFGFITLPTIAQEEENTPKKSSGKSKTIIIGADEEEEESSESEENASSFVESTNLVKLNISPFVTGAALVSYSKAFGDVFAVELSLGTAYSNSLMYLLYDDFVSTNNITDQNAFVPVRNATDEYNYKPGFMYRIQTRFFTDADYTHEGSYYALEFAQRNVRYNFEYDIFDNQTGSLTTFTADYARMRSNEFKIVYGWQGTFGDSNIFWDFNTGLGLFTQKNDYIYYEGNPLTSKPLTAPGETYYGFRYNIGFAIGYGF